MARALAHRLLLGVSLVATLTCAAPQAVPAPQSREEALAALEDPATERRAEAIAWIANHGTMADQPLLVARLRDESPFVRGFAEQGLWLLWSRSGETEIDRLMAAGVEDLQAGRYSEALAAFSAVIRRRPDFAEGWNRRATAYFLAGDFERALSDCEEVLRRNPLHFGALAGCGEVLLRLGREEEALARWRRALEVNPNLVGVELNLRRLLERRRPARAR
ncbi:MAG: tetratricopeptide repeat protein [Burkholderiales bacterium]|nr:tetratricopeptide repeat protein [Burkholderiales bacterium]